MDDVTRRIGRRGAYLLASAVLYAIYGYSLVAWPANRPVSEVYAVLTRLMPIGAWGWAWIATSAVCAAMAFTLRDRIGYAALSLMVGCWSIGTLLGAALRSGIAPADAVDLVSRALPGAAADRLVPVAARLRLGGDPVTIWAALGADPELAPLGRTLARAQRTGAPIVGAVERLGEELARRGRAEVEDRARAIGVRAAVPLGLCLLPSFLVLGIVPLAVSLATTITG